MSIEYGFVDRRRKQQVEKLDAKLLELKQYCIEYLRQISQEDPDLEDDIADKIFQLERAEAFRAPSYDSDDMVIGVSTSKHFLWAGSFHSKEDIRKFLAEHPDCYIEDEYRQAIDANEFIDKICST